MTQNYINHIALVLDASGSMDHLIPTVVKVADQFVAHLAQRSKELDQETRVTIYSFSGQRDIACLIYDKDVLRLPSIKSIYHGLGGMTALLDATLKALGDLEKTAQLYGDHAFLTYVLTDGEENNSFTDKTAFHSKIASLMDNWTLAVFVPSQVGAMEAKRFGFPAANIALWDTTVSGTEAVGSVIRKTTDSYMTARSKGIRGSRNLFTMDTQALDKATVQAVTVKLRPGQFRFLTVAKEGPIADFIEWELRRPYKIGEAYYQLTKPVIVQPQKNVALYDRRQHMVFTGPSARTLLGLPDADVKVSPENYSDYEIYIQSTSVNRKLVPGTKVLVLS